MVKDECVDGGLQYDGGGNRDDNEVEMKDTMKDSGEDTQGEGEDHRTRNDGVGVVGDKMGEESLESLKSKVSEMKQPRDHIYKNKNKDIARPVSRGSPTTTSRRTSKVLIRISIIRIIQIIRIFVFIWKAS